MVNLSRYVVRCWIRTLSSRRPSRSVRQSNCSVPRLCQTGVFDAQLSASLEPLEDRTLLTIIASFGETLGLLIVDATDDGDVVLVEHDGTNIIVNSSTVPNINTMELATLTNVTGIIVRGEMGVAENNDFRILSDFTGITVALQGGGGNDTLIGGPGPETLLGEGGNNDIRGNGGDDTIQGGTGDDTLVGGDGADFIEGSLGNDQLFGGAGNDTLSGGAGDDTLQGGDDNDEVEGGTGNDSLYGQGGDDSLTGGDGNDGYGFEGSGLGHDMLMEDPGDTTGNDFIEFSFFSSAVMLDLANTSAQTVSTGNLTLTLSNNVAFEILIGSDFDDTLTGNAADNFIFGGDGHDSISGGPGDDFLFGLAGDDTLLGDAGFDSLNGGLGDDSQQGGSDSDWYLFDENAAGADIINDLPSGAPCTDEDVFDFSASLLGITVNLASTMTQQVTTVLQITFAADQMIEDVFGSDFDDIIVGNECPNLIDGGDGTDGIDGGGENDTILGGNGSDAILGGAGDDLLLGDSYLSLTRDGEDVILTFALGNGDDTLDGEGGSDTLIGGDGNDELWGNMAAPEANDPDSLFGDAVENDAEGNLTFHGSGNDTLTGTAGGDVLVGGSGDDLLNSGPGLNLLIGDEANPALVLLVGLDESSLFTGSGNDTLFGGAQRDSLHGGAGDDRLDGAGGNDDIYGFDGNDTLFGADGDDRVQGGAGDDAVMGNAGQDLVIGDSITLSAPYYLLLEMGLQLVIETASDSGHDTLRGGAGSDLLIGGSGNDDLRGDEDADSLFGDEVLISATSIRFSGTGNDLLAGGVDDADDELFGGLGDDSLYGGPGADFLVGDEGPNEDYDTDLPPESLLSGAGNDLLDGEDGEDILLGGDGADFIRGGAGNDQILGHAGNDTLLGNEGDDVLQGGSDDDSLNGDDGLDLLVGDSVTLRSPYVVVLGIVFLDIETAFDTGNDTLQGGIDDDILIGGSGDDELDGEFDSDTLIGDEIRMVGSTVVFSGTGNDSLLGGVGIWPDVLYGGQGNDSLDGGGGDDLLIGDEGPGMDYDTEVPPDSLLSGSGNDLLVGGDGHDTLLGVGGDDTLLGGSGDDLLVGYDGDDSLSGEDGDDRLRSRSGFDLLEGGPGIDSINLLDSTSGATIDLDSTSAQVVTGQLMLTILDPLEAFIGTMYADLVRVDPLVSVARSLAAGSPDAAPGDVLLYDNMGAAVITSTNQILVDGFETLAHFGFETVVLDDGAFGDTSLLVTFSPDGVVVLDNSGTGNQVTLLFDGLVPTLQSSLPLVVPAGSGLVIEGSSVTLPPVAMDDVGVRRLNLTINTGAGDDTLTLNLPDTADGIQLDLQYQAGTGSNSLFLSGTGYERLSASYPSIDLSMLLVESTIGSMPPEPGSGASISADRVQYIDGTDTPLSAVLFTLSPNNDALALSVSAPQTLIADFGDTSEPVARQLLLDMPQSLTLLGGAGDDTIDAGAAGPLPVFFYGEDGNDFLQAGDGTGVLVGGAGDDTLSGGAGNDLLVGGPDDDLLIGRAGNDELIGDSGNDTLKGGAGADELSGGTGSDLLQGQGTTGDTLDGGDDDDTLDGGGGNDLIREIFAADAVLTNSTMTGRGNDVVISLERARLNGGPAGQVIDVSAFFTVGLTSATLNGGSGDDSLFGSPGRDVLTGASGSDLIDGGAAGDRLFGGAGPDTLLGGDGDDLLRGQGGSGDRLTGGFGDDTLDGGIGIDRVIEVANVDLTMTNTSMSGLGLDVLRSIEVAELSGGESDNVIDVSGFLSLKGFTLLRGNGGNDLIIGSDGRDVIHGGAGDDTLLGKAGNDVLYGNDGDDGLSGFTGNDAINGGAGFDLGFGGEGNDTLAGGNDADTLIGGNGDDYIQGDDGVDTLVGGTGNNDPSPGDTITDATAFIDESFILDPLPDWVDQV